MGGDMALSFPSWDAKAPDDEIHTLAADFSARVARECRGGPAARLAASSTTQRACRRVVAESRRVPAASIGAPVLDAVVAAGFPWAALHGIRAGAAVCTAIARDPPDGAALRVADGLLRALCDLATRCVLRAGFFEAASRAGPDSADEASLRALTGLPDTMATAAVQVGVPLSDLPARLVSAGAFAERLVACVFAGAAAAERWGVLARTARRIALCGWRRPLDGAIYAALASPSAPAACSQAAAEAVLSLPAMTRRRLLRALLQRLGEDPRAVAAWPAEEGEGEGLDPLPDSPLLPSLAARPSPLFERLARVGGDEWLDALAERGAGVPAAPAAWAAVRACSAPRGVAAWPARALARVLPLWASPEVAAGAETEYGLFLSRLAVLLLATAADTGQSPDPDQHMPDLMAGVQLRIGAADRLVQFQGMGVAQALAATLALPADSDSGSDGGTLRFDGFTRAAVREAMRGRGLSERGPSTATHSAHPPRPWWEHGEGDEDVVEEERVVEGGTRGESGGPAPAAAVHAVEREREEERGWDTATSNSLEPLEDAETSGEEEDLLVEGAAARASGPRARARAGAPPALAHWRGAADSDDEEGEDGLFPTGDRARRDAASAPKRSTVSLPAYPRQALQQLRTRAEDGDAAEKQRAALLGLPRLLRRRPRDLPLVVTELTALLFVAENTFAWQKFPARRHACLVALAGSDDPRVHGPAVAYLLDQFASVNHTVAARGDVLDVLADAARVMAGVLPPPGQEAAAVHGEEEEEEEDDGGEVGVTKHTGVGAGAGSAAGPRFMRARVTTRRRRRPRAKTQAGSAPNAFAAVAGEFFFPLLRAAEVGREEAGLDLFGRHSQLLAMMLTTLGTMVECARQAPCAAGMVTALAHTAYAARDHEEPAVRRAALYAVMQALSSPHAGQAVGRGNRVWQDLAAWVADSAARERDAISREEAGALLRVPGFRALAEGP